MKKFWKITGIFVFSIFVLFVVGLIGGYIFLKNFDIAKYKPQIVKMAGEALGRPVDFKDIGLTVSWGGGVRFQLSDFSIGENPDYGTEAFVFAKEIDAGFDIISFVTARRIAIPNILISSPRISIIRNAKGVLSVQTLGPSQPGSSSRPGLSSQGKGPSVGAAALPAIFINSFKISDAELHFIDKFDARAQKVSITKLNFEVRKFSLTNPFDVILDAAVLSAQTDLRVNGKMQLALARNEVKLMVVDVFADLSQVSLEQLQGLSMLKGVVIPQVLKGQIKAKVKEAVLSDKGVGTLMMNVSLNGGQIVAADSASGILLEAQQIDLSIDNFSLNGSAPFQVNLAAALYQDTINVSFKSDGFFNPQTAEVRFANGQFTTDLALWPLEKIKSAIAPLKTVPLPESLAGELQVMVKNLKFSAAGLQTVLLDVNLSGGGAAFKNSIPDTFVEFKKIDLAVKDFSLTRPFVVSLKTAYVSDDPNISFEGTVRYDLKTQAVEMNDALVRFDFDRFSLEDFKASGLVPKGVPFPQVIGGKFEARINSFAASSLGVSQANVDIGWQNGKVAISELAPGISVTANSINVNVKRVSLNDAFDVTASLAYESDMPNISFSGNVRFDPASQNVRLSQSEIKIDLSLIPFARLKESLAPLKTVPLPEILKGQLYVLVKELSAGPKGLAKIMADVILQKGEISMAEAAPGVSFSASRINASIREFGLGTPFGFSVELAYLHDFENVKVLGTAAIRTEDQSVYLKDTTIEADLSTFAMDQLKSSIAALKDASLPEKLQGKFYIVIAEAVAGAKGLSQLASEGALQGGEVTFKEFSLPIQGIDTKFRLTEKEFTMDSIQARLGKGQIVAHVGVSDYLARRDFTLSAELKGIDLSEVLDQKEASVKVEGQVFGSLKAQGQGADINSITGGGNFEVKAAKLKDFNVLKTLLDKISFLPNAASRVEASLPEKYKEKLKSKDTVINKVSTVAVISSGAVVLDPVSIEADEFLFAGKSQAGFDQKYTLDGAVKIPAELSDAMVTGVSEMQYLRDENKNISLPVHVSGQGAQSPVISVTQTAIDMGKNALRNEGKKELEKVLNKLLGAGENPSSSDSRNQQTGDAPKDQPSPASQLIDDIFKVLE